jgi:hypothetical protein
MRRGELWELFRPPETHEQPALEKHKNSYGAPIRIQTASQPALSCSADMGRFAKRPVAE